MTSPFDLTGKVAAVIGANTGIGQAIALARTVTDFRFRPRAALTKARG